MKKLFSIFAALTLSVGLWAQSPGTFAQLQQLVNDATAGSTLTLDKDYTFEGTEAVANGGVEINKNLVLDLGGHTINGNQKSRCFVLTGGAQASLIQVTIKNGTITNGYTQYNGGAIAVGITSNDYVNATINNCTISSCKSEQTAGRDNGYGGGIYVVPTSKCTISKTIFSQNTAGWGGAMENDGTCIVNGATFTENSATKSGGAIYNYKGECTIDSTTLFSQNTATRGGALYNDEGTCTINGATFTENSTDVDGYGGCIYNYKGECTIDSTTLFSQNTATWGGVLYNNEGNYTINGATFTENSASVEGGGGCIYNYIGECTIDSTTLFSQNTAGWGGVLYNDEGTCTINGATFTKNSASVEGSGGCIFNYEGTCTITDAIFSQNTAGWGGAIINQDESVLNLIAASGKSIVIENNHATQAEGGVINVGTINISGTVIVKDNDMGTNNTPSNFSEYNEIPVNIVGDMTGSNIYFELVDENDAFTYGTLTSGYSTHSGSTELNAFFHYDGPDTWAAVLKEGEIVVALVDPTALPNVDSKFKIQNSKFIKDGQLFLLQGKKTYTILGQGL